ncbi:hypothetical protein TNCV_617121 [Trichonephila clavipes]|nr:hypothetical protein TNCV_617121 [Trichonephila clavipes]
MIHLKDGSSSIVRKSFSSKQFAIIPETFIYDRIRLIMQEIFLWHFLGTLFPETGTFEELRNVFIALVFMLLEIYNNLLQFYSFLLVFPALNKNLPSDRHKSGTGAFYKKRPFFPFKNFPASSSSSEIGQCVGRNQATVRRICHRGMLEQTTEQRNRSLPPTQPSDFTTRDGRRVVRMVLKDRASTSQLILSVTHPSVSTSIIRRRLLKSGMSARHPLLRLLWRPQAFPSPIVR